MSKVHGRLSSFCLLLSVLVMIFAADGVMLVFLVVLQSLFLSI